MYGEEAASLRRWSLCFRAANCAALRIIVTVSNDLVTRQSPIREEHTKTQGARPIDRQVYRHVVAAICDRTALGYFDMKQSGDAQDLFQCPQPVGSDNQVR